MATARQLSVLCVRRRPRCKRLTVVVPNQAKSAATLLAMGAHAILMGPTSDLGPVDPQFQNPSGRGLYAAKDLIAAVENAQASIAANPDSYPLYVSLLADVSAVMVQQARSALARTQDLVREALRSNPDRDEKEVDALTAALQKPLWICPATTEQSSAPATPGRQAFR